jgi:hypothetical protein
MTVGMLICVGMMIVPSIVLAAKNRTKIHDVTILVGTSVE